jgi:tellurite resistance protein
MLDRQSSPSVQHLNFAWFAMVMGLCGLSLAWMRSVPHWSGALQVSMVVGVAAVVVFLLLLVATVWRGLRYPAAVWADARHPVRQVFVAALPSSLVLIATVAVAHGGYSLWADGAWMLGSTGLLLVTVGVVKRWFQPGTSTDDFWAAMTPALFIPVVGHVLPALAGVSLGHPVWAAAQYGIAAVLWPVSLALVLVRIGQVGLWPERMLASTFIAIAPPSVLALSGVQLGAPDVLVHMLWGVALLFTGVSMTVFRRSIAQPFGMPFWGLSFPLAASAALSLHLAPVQGLAHVLALLWLGWVTLVIGALLCATVLGLLQGRLLVPEVLPHP